jgi:pimeloyl-ACP methyl ester carboxylesterase
MPLCDLSNRAGFFFRPSRYSPPSNPLQSHPNRRCRNQKYRYILTLFNIPGNGAPVLLQHGLLDSSYTWINNFADESLGYILADKGFDIWFGNNRGNRYGRQHTTKNPDDGTNDFWAFTWDEMATIDAPSMINFVLAKTGYKSLGWVGHSEGTIQMFAAGSSTEESALVKDAMSKVNLFVALAPVAYVSNQQSKELRAMAESHLTKVFLNKGVYEFLPYGNIEFVAPTMCQVGPTLCDKFLATICGPTTNINETRIQVYVSETPAGTSTTNMDHWSQGVLKDTFQKYDLGVTGNMKKYGTAEPPLYDLSKFALPVALFSGGNDYLADVADVTRLIDELPADKIVFNQFDEDYAHLDYVWAYNAGSRIYASVANLLQQYAATK